LRDRYTLAMLSNVNVLHLSYLKQRYALFDAFHHIFASCEMGMRKPDPRIYEAVLERLAVSPGEVFYTDDRPELIKCAQALGIKGFVFTDIQQLIDDLASHDIRLLQR
nr:HAD-IA family hydrolase [Candidatus Omnitrophota bacterium]